MNAGAFQAIIGLAGGVGLFIFGMQECSDGLQKAAARGLKRWIKVLTGKPIPGLLTGAIATFALQGSNATSALVVGFVSAGAMTLSQSLGVLLGSAIGSSLTAQIIAFKTTEVALALIFIGAGLRLFAKRSRWRNIGHVVLGFGLILYGMSVMSSAMAPVRDFPAVARVLVNLERYPLLEFAAATVVTAAIQSSPAFLGLLMSLSANGLIGPYAIIPFILGAHLGGTVTGLLSSLGAPGRDSKRAAIANFALKLANGLVFLPFYRPLADLVAASSSNVSRQVANAHTLFSLLMAVCFLPFIGLLAKLMIRVIPEKHTGLGEARYLDDSLLEVPELALDQARRQTGVMGEIVRDEMLGRFLPALHYGRDEAFERITMAEPALDALYKKISSYVTKLGNRNLSDDLMQSSVQILYAANDLEHVGDVLMNVVQILRKLKMEDLELSEEGLEEVEALQKEVYERFDASLRAFERQDEDLAGRIIKGHPKILRDEKALRYSHFDRMQSGNARTRATSALHLDLLEALIRIDGHAVNTAQGVMGFI